MAALAFLLQREVIVSTALLGGLVAVLGSLIASRENAALSHLGRGAVRLGYSLSGLSVILFIVAGFMLSP